MSDVAILMGVRSDVRRKCFAKLENKSRESKTNIHRSIQCSHYRKANTVLEPLGARLIFDRADSVIGARVTV